jgi:hypothetical protein
VKLIWCDGRRLEVRDVGPVIFAMREGGLPLKPAGGFRLMRDEDARALLRDLLSLGIHTREECRETE